MRVLRSRTRTRSKPPRKVSGRSTRTRDTSVRTRKSPRRNSNKGIWHNWLMEENYL